MESRIQDCHEFPYMGRFSYRIVTSVANDTDKIHADSSAFLARIEQAK